MWAWRNNKQCRLLGILLATCLLAASAVSSVKAFAPDKDGGVGSHQVIVLLVEQLQMEDIAGGLQPALLQFTGQGGAGFLHVSKRQTSGTAIQEQGLLQLDAAGIGQLEERLEQVGIGVQRLPEPGMFNRNGGFPGGRMLDWRRLAAEIKSRSRSSANREGQFILVEFDGLAKVKGTFEELDEQQYRKYLNITWDVLDGLVQELVKLAGPETIVIMAGSSQGTPLVPLFASGGDIPAHSLLSSASTRHPGIVTSGDTAVSILRFLGAAAPGYPNGNPLIADSSVHELPKELQQMWMQMEETQRRRPAILTIYAAAAAVLLTAMSIIRSRLKRLPERMPSRAASLLAWGSTAVLITPLLLLLPQSVPIAGKLWSWWVAAGGLVLLYGLMRIRNQVKRTAVIAVLTIGLVVGDCVLGGTLARQSILSYDPIAGIRFYGIGNEYMGILVAWFLLGSASCLTLFPKWLGWGRWGVPLLGTGLALFLAWPGFGANAGGTIAAAAAAAAVGIYLQKPGKAGAFAETVLLLSAVIGLLVVFNQQTKLPTHITLAGSMFLHGDFDAIGDIVVRKLRMNARLMGVYTSPVFIMASMGVLLSLAWRPNRLLASLQQEFPMFFLFAKAGVWTAAAAFVFNDSGVVAAVMVLLPFACTLGQLTLTAGIPIPHTAVPAEASPADRPDFSIGTDPGR